MNTTILSVVVAATLALTAVDGSAQDRANQPLTLEIESETLADALDQWARQTGFQLFSPNWSLAKKLNAPTVKGKLSAQAALERLLAGTPLTYAWIGDRAVTVRERTEEQPSAATRSLDTPSASSPHVLYLGEGPAGGGAGPLVAPSSSPTNGAPSIDSSNETIQEVIVTGSYIRGGGVPVGSYLRTYSREEIDRSGAGTVDQFARQMTENFSNVDQLAGQFSSASRFGPSGTSGNVYGGSAFNLRGVGATATLTLLDGNRVAPAGIKGGLTDTSLIPLTAIDRIEVLADGASAIYGADAVAGVVNMITRKDFEGAETTVRVGDTVDGGGAQYTASQAFGAAWDSGGVMLNYQYNKQDELEVSDRSYLPDPGGPLLLMPENETHSMFLSGHQQLGPRTNVSGHAVYAEREGFVRTRDVRTGLNLDASFAFEVAQTSASVSLVQGLFGDWVANLTGNYSRAPQDSNGRGVTTIGFTSLSEQSVTTEVSGADALMSGTLLHLPAGPLKAAVGAAHRNEEFENSSINTSVFNGVTLATVTQELRDRDRRVNSAFAEFRVPLFGSAEIPIVELSAAGRYDDYSDFGSAETYKLGVRWTLVEGLQLRGTFGTSFKAPLLIDLWTPVLVDAARAFPDPIGSPTGTSNLLSVSGGNPDLRPEESEAFTAGIDINPALIPNLTLGITYFDIDFMDRIGAANLQGIFTTNPQAVPFINRSPSLAQVQAYFAMPGLRNPTFLTPSDINLIYVGNQLTNLSGTRQSGVDLNTSYSLQTVAGAFTLSLSGSRLLKNEVQTLPSQPAFDYRNTFAQPLKWKGRGGVSWAREPFSASLFVNYANSYRNGLGTTAANPRGSELAIDSWTTADINLSYRTAESNSGAILRGLTVALTVNNVTDEKPPRVEIPGSVLLPGQYYLPFDAANASPLGTFVSLQIMKDW